MISSSSAWTDNLQSQGAVFLPAAGYRSGTSVDGVDSYGYYWSASCNYSSGAYGVYFGYGNLLTGNWIDRFYGLSVRLVCPAE